MMSNNLSPVQLRKVFIKDLGDCLESVEGSEKPIVINLKSPVCCKAKIYLFNCTNPPGGRSPYEYKSQLIKEGQKKNERGVLDDTDGTIIFLIGYARPYDDEEKGVYVIWETERHREFAFSANLQITLQELLKTALDVNVCVKKTGEVVVAAGRQDLVKALIKRMEIDRKRLIDEEV